MDGGGIDNAGMIHSQFNTFTGNTPNDTVGVTNTNGTTYVVTSTADQTTGNTLRNAIIQANASAGDDTIEFNFASNSTIMLTLGPLVIDPSTSGDGLNIINIGTGTVTIDASGNGPNANNVDEDGTSAPNTSSGRIFEIRNTSGNVEISGQSALITLQNAYANSANGPSPGNGGAIFDHSIADLDILNVTFKGDVAYASGGALYFDNGPVYVTNSTFGATGAGNTATTGSGGAVCGGSNYGLTVNDTTFSSNVSNGGDGGAIYCDNANGLAVLGGSSFTKNSANDPTAADGGAICQTDKSLVIDSSTFMSNSAQSAGSASGGAVYNDGYSASITNASFTSNKSLATSGGDAYGGAIAELAEYPLSVGACVSFTTNTAHGGAGIIAGGAGGSAYGGAIYDQSDPGTVVATFSGNSALGGAASGTGFGGGNADAAGIYDDVDELLLACSSFTNNLAKGGAAVAPRPRAVRSPAGTSMSAPGL